MSNSDRSEHKQPFQSDLNGFLLEGPADPDSTDALDPPAVVVSEYPVHENGILNLPEGFLERIDADVAASGGEIQEDPRSIGSFGRTMFDLPSSQNDEVTVLMPKEHIGSAPSQALVRLKSSDGRSYLGMVTGGPFGEPDNIRGDSPIIVTVATRGALLLPHYHGRVQVEILGEEMADGTLIPPRFRPLPNSFAFALNDAETGRVLNTGGDFRLGCVVGQDRVEVKIPSRTKQTLPRHGGVLGTTGGGKTTTTSGFAVNAVADGMSVTILDIEGEYTALHEATSDRSMIGALSALGRNPSGVPVDRMTVYHLVGREPKNPEHPNLRAFSLQFARLSPYAVAEILELPEAQEQRFIQAYDITKLIMRDFGIFPRTVGTPKQDGSFVTTDERERDEKRILDLDELDRGYPRMTLALLRDVVQACASRAEKTDITPEWFASRRTWRDSNGDIVKDRIDKLKARIDAAKNPGDVRSWRSLWGKLNRLARLGIFDTDVQGARPLNYQDFLQPGHLCVIDLSDSEMTAVSNLVIADLLRGIQEAQDENYTVYERTKREDPSVAAPTRVLIMVEEAHEFLSARRIDKMPVLFQQVTRIAKRGRKRWLGLVFITQHPQHLPQEVLGLLNWFILHRITDAKVKTMLQNTVPNVDETLWNRLRALAPGQAIVSFPHMTRPLMVAIDPTPAKLLLVD